MPDDDFKQVYWRDARRLASGTVFVAVTLTAGLLLSLQPLNELRFLRFPLGYFLLTVGLAVLLPGLVYLFFSRQQANDRAHSVTIQF